MSLGALHWLFAYSSEVRFSVMLFAKPVTVWFRIKIRQ